MTTFNLNTYQELKDDFSHHFDTLKLKAKNFDKSFDFSKLKLSCFSYYWIDQVINFLELKEMIDDCEQKDQNPLSETQDIIFYVLSNSEYADHFLNEHEKVNTIKNASLNTLDLIEQQLHAIKEMYFQNKISNYPGYRPIFEFAEFDIDTIGPKSPQKTIKLDDLEIAFYSFDFDMLEQHTQRIEQAIERIQRYSPSSFERLSVFTQVLIPLKQEELVSYSEQNLPGVSIINLYNRDDLDLMDDLLHENGHHHLNYYLNQEELLIEADEKIFYSPWRESLRPIRGIFHAVFTFYWALKLYFDLLQDSSKFSKSEQEKMLKRFQEEYLMIQYCRCDLDYAFEKDIIFPRGMEIINSIYSEIDSMKTFYEQNRNTQLEEKYIEIRKQHNLK